MLEDLTRRHALEVDRLRERIRRDERIEEQRLAGDFNGETSVAEVGEFHKMNVLPPNRRATTF